MRASFAPWLGLIGGGLSLLAMANMPYGYYTFNRVAVTAVAVILCVIAVRADAPGWLFLLAPIAVLWNPAIPIHLDRGTWAPLNFIAALVFLGSGFMLARRGSSDAMSSRPEG